jgi:hypothetical protein
MMKAAQTVTARGQSEPPADLARFIELVNAERLFERELPDLFLADLNDDLKMSAEHYNSTSPLDRYHEHCEAASAKLSAQTRAYLGPPSDEEFTEKYHRLRDAGQVLSAIAKCGAGLGERAENLMISDARFPGEAFPFVVSVNLVVNEDGLLTASDNPLLGALRGVRADRIRSCKVCRRIFWAPRVNSECCCESCRKTYNQRNSREARRKLASKKKHRTKKGK